MDAVDVLKVIGLYLGIMGGFILLVLAVYRVFMALVFKFGDSVSYNVYRPVIPKKGKNVPPK